MQCRPKTESRQSRPFHALVVAAAVVVVAVAVAVAVVVVVVVLVVEGALNYAVLRKGRGTFSL